MQFNTLKILDTVLGFISVGQFSQSTVTGVWMCHMLQQKLVTMW
jgi:hypothetical protein